MQLINNLKGLFRGNAKKLDHRFKKRKTWFHTLTGTVNVVTEIDQTDKFGLKTVQAEKVEKVRSRYARLKFPSESEISECIQHEHVLGTLESGRANKNDTYILTDYIDGPFLEEVILNHGKKLRGKQIKLIQQLADAVTAIHDHGFIHRDLSPKNILCNSTLDQLKVCNFSLTIPNSAEFLRIKNRVGTPLYMAPEIIRRRGTDERVDMFAFGVIAYQIITLRHPWGVTDNNSQSALVFDSKPPVDIRQIVPQLSSSVGKAIMKCLEVDPDHRFASMKQFSQLAGLT